MITLRSWLLFFCLLTIGGWAHGATFYVSPSGSDANPGTFALPKATIQAAINSTNNSDSVVVLPGTYVGKILINGKTISLIGAASVGATKPVLTLDTGSVNQTLIYLNYAPNTVIQGFQIDLDQSYLLVGLQTSGKSDNLQIRDILIRVFGSNPTKHSGGPGIYTEGLHLEGSGANFPSYKVTNVNIQPTVGTNSADTWYVQRGILLRGIKGVVGGSPAEACTIKAARDILVQFNGGGETEIAYNNLNGGGIDITLPDTTGSFFVHDNNFEPDYRGAFLLSDVLFLKQNAFRAPTLIKGNTFKGYSSTGVRAAGFANAHIIGNTFQPSDTSKDFTSIEVNTLWEGTVQTPLTVNGITIKGNTFLGAAQGRLRGTAIFLKNERPGATTPDYDTVVIGGLTQDANSFAENIRKFIKCDNQVFRQFKVNIDGSQNLYTVGGSAFRPANLNTLQLFILEDKLDHAIDDTTVGFIRVRPKATYVTPKSFYAPVTVVADIQRALFLSQPGDTIHIQDSIYTPPVVVNKDILFNPSGSATVVSDLTIATPNPQDQLRLDKTINVSGALALTNGKIKLSTASLKILNPTSTTPPVGSDNSYVITDSSGTLILANLDNNERNLPIGTLLAYRPIVMSNQGTGDTVALRMRPHVLTQAFTGTPIDTTVDFTWFFTESVPGGGSYTFKPLWRGSDERPNFYRNKTFLQRYKNNKWQFLTGPVPNYLPIAGVDPYLATASKLDSIFDPNTALRIYGPKEIPDTIFFVDGVDGLDNFPDHSGRTPEYAWRTINYAVSNSFRVAPSRRIHIRVKNVAPAYDETVVIPSDKGRMDIRGGYTGADGPPTVQQTTSGAPIITVSADTVILKKLNFRISGTGARAAVNGLTKYDKLWLDSSQIVSGSNTPTGTGINLNPATSPQQIRVTASVLGTNNGILASGITGGSIYGQVGGGGSLSNSIAAARAIAVSDVSGGEFLVSQNTIVSSLAGIVANGGQGTLTIVKNTLDGNNGKLGLGLEAIGLNAASSTIRIDSNIVSGDTTLVLVNNQNASATSNTFTSGVAGAVLGTGLAGKTFPSYVSQSLALQGNTWLATAGAKVGLYFNNEGSAFIATPYTQLTIGSTATPNQFGNAFGKFIQLQFTQTKEYGQDLDVRYNQFGVAGGLKFPAAMTLPELFETEDKIDHKIDFAGIGLVRVQPKELYITPQSFLPPRTIKPALQRTVPPSGDGDKVRIKDSDYTDTTFIDKNLTFSSLGNATRHNRLQMNAGGKILTIENDFTVYGGLALTQGLVKIVDNNLILTEACPQPEGGTSSSYVWTSGNGGLRQNGVGPGGAKADSLFYPVGLDTTFNPIYIRNTGTKDDLQVRLLGDVFENGLSGARVPDSVAAVSWVLTEGQPGGSKLHVRPFWKASQEKRLFARNRVGIQGFFGSWVPDEVLPRKVAGTNPFSAAREFVGQSFAETPIRVITLPNLKDDVYIPTFFSPNEDGNNDILLAYSNTISTIDLKIFNRYGNVVYHASDTTEALTKGWDGTFNGSKLNTDTYVWTLTGTYKNGKPIACRGRRTGYVILSR